MLLSLTSCIFRQESALSRIIVNIVIFISGVVKCGDGVPHASGFYRLVRSAKWTMKDVYHAIETGQLAALKI